MAFYIHENDFINQHSLINGHRKISSLNHKLLDELQKSYMPYNSVSCWASLNEPFLKWCPKFPLSPFACFHKVCSFFLPISHYPLMNIVVLKSFCVHMIIMNSWYKALKYNFRHPCSWFVLNFYCWYMTTYLAFLNINDAVLLGADESPKDGIQVACVLL